VNIGARKPTLKELFPSAKQIPLHAKKMLKTTAILDQIDTPFFMGTIFIIRNVLEVPAVGAKNALLQGFATDNWGYSYPLRPLAPKGK